MFSVCFRGHVFFYIDDIPKVRAIHRRDVKCLIVFIKEFLCVLCVFAVKAMFMDSRQPSVIRARDQSYMKSSRLVRHRTDRMVPISSSSWSFLTR